MAWLDHNWDLQDSAAITSATTTTGTHVINMGAAVPIGVEKDMFFNVEIGTVSFDTGDEYLDCRLYGADNEGMSSNKILVGATGSVIPVTISTQTFRARTVTAKQYYRMEYVTVGTWAGGDTVTIVGVDVGRTEQSSMALPAV